MWWNYVHMYKNGKMRCTERNYFRNKERGDKEE
jgi:hypothetical protein